MNGAIRAVRIENTPLWALVCSGFSPALVAHAKAVPGMRFEKAIGDIANAWVGYVDAVTATVARLQHAGLTVFGISDLPGKDAWRDATAPMLFATAGLREYQVEGARFLITHAREGTILADGMRLGKTCQSVTAARAFKSPTLIACPAHVVGVWARPKGAPEGPGEIAKWWPDAWKTREVDAAGNMRPGVVTLSGVSPVKHRGIIKKLGALKTRTPAEEKALETARAALRVAFASIKHANVIVGHYDIIYAWVEAITTWAGPNGFTFILDEIHILAGYQSRRSDAIKALAEAAPRRIGLTGTPITNKPRQTHNVLESICPGRFGYFFAGTREGVYSKLYCNAHQKQVGKGADQLTVWDFNGRSNLDVPDGIKAVTHEETLAHRLSYMMLRRLKKDVDPELPQKVRQIIDVTIPPKQVIGVSHGMLDKGGKELRQCLDLAADGKLKTDVSVLEGHMAEGEKALAFCYRRAFTETLAADLKKKVADDVMVKHVHGGMSQKDRDKAIHAVRTHNGPACLVCTIDTTSTGIDLSFASVAVFCELVWEPHELAQAEERLYKFGSNQKALVQYVIARGTGDELILRGVISKLETAEALIGATGDAMREDLSASRGDPMKRLYDALMEMRKGDGSASGAVGAAGAVDKPKRVRELKSV